MLKNGIDGESVNEIVANSTAQSSNPPPQSLLDAREQMVHVDTNVDENIGKFEEKRIVDMKLFLEDFVRKEVSERSERALKIAHMKRPAAV